jgi:hypothetical protein
MAIILKANKVNLFVSFVLFVFWSHSPNVLDTPHICNISWLRVKLVCKPFKFNSSRNASCGQLKELKILSVQPQYIFSVLLFAVKNKDRFLFNSQERKINTRLTSNLYLPSANLTTHQRGMREKTHKYTSYSFNLSIMYGSSYMFRHYIVILRECS